MKTPEELGLTSKQVANFRKLERFLWRPLPSATTFDMRTYLMRATGQECRPDASTSSECGTTRCALGCGPLAGVPVGSADGWTEYCSRNFCGSRTATWNWVFHPQWSWVDNTRQGAANRIRWLLEHGCPDNSDQQLWGSEPLCYPIPADRRQRPRRLATKS